MTSQKLERDRTYGVFAVGTLADSKVALIFEIRHETSYRTSFFVAVGSTSGLFRLRSGRAPKLICPAFEGHSRSLSKESGAKRSPWLDFIPRCWGKPRDILFKQIPQWILKSESADFARLLLAWQHVEETSNHQRSLSFDRQFIDDTLPIFPLISRPVAIVTIPNTSVVIAVLDSGLLLHRLKLGLERIYISEMSWMLAPSTKHSLLALATRFHGRLVLVKARSFKRLAEIMKVKRFHAGEYQFIGAQLTDSYRDDFGYSKFNNSGALKGMYRYTIGDLPRGLKMLWMHEKPLSVEEWSSLTIDAMRTIESENVIAKKARQEEAFIAIAEALPNAIEDPIKHPEPGS